MTAPPNLSKDVKGFNSSMFKSDRAVRRGFRVLGYAVNPRDHKVPANTVRQFQRDFNRCGERFGRWGQVKVTGKLNRNTLNALEHAIRWSKKRENREGVPSARSWQALCADRSSGCTDPASSNQRGPRRRRAYAQADQAPPDLPERGTNFVEVLSNGTGKLRNIHTDHALRCNIIAFERYGDTVFVLVEVPPQGDLPGGRPDHIKCPCIFAR